MVERVPNVVIIIINIGGLLPGEINIFFKMSYMQFRPNNLRI